MRLHQLFWCKVDGAAMGIVSNVAGEGAAAHIEITVATPKDGTTALTSTLVCLKGAAIKCGVATGEPCNATAPIGAVASEDSLVKANAD